VAYKNSVGARRTAWRTISAIQQKEEYKVIEIEILLTFDRDLVSLISSRAIAQRLKRNLKTFAMMFSSS
jgi:hypothetical protein